MVHSSSRVLVNGPFTGRERGDAGSSGPDPEPASLTPPGTGRAPGPAGSLPGVHAHVHLVPGVAGMHRGAGRELGQAGANAAPGSADRPSLSHRRRTRSLRSGGLPLPLRWPSLPLRCPETGYSRQNANRVQGKSTRTGDKCPLRTIPERADNPTCNIQGVNPHIHPVAAAADFVQGHVGPINNTGPALSPRPQLTDRCSTSPALAGCCRFGRARAWFSMFVHV